MTFAGGKTTSCTVLSAHHEKRKPHRAAHKLYYSFNTFFNIPSSSGADQRPAGGSAAKRKAQSAMKRSRYPRTPKQGAKNSSSQPQPAWEGCLCHKKPTKFHPSLGCWEQNTQTQKNPTTSNDVPEVICVSYSIFHNLRPTQPFLLWNATDDLCYSAEPQIWW